MENTNQKLVQKFCENNGWDFDKLDLYFNLIETYNKVMNLTGFSGDKLWGEGILESLIYMQNAVDENSEQILEVLDIGAGVGFPSLPYAIFSKHNFTIYEPLQKRVNFLNIVIEKLNLKNIQVKRVRAEEVTDKNIFDVVVARAVGTVKTMLMSSFHLVKVNGAMSLIKGKNLQNEIDEAHPIFKLLKYETKTDKLNVPNLEKENYVYSIIKKRSCPKQFPYSWKEIKKNT